MLLMGKGNILPFGYQLLCNSRFPNAIINDNFVESLWDLDSVGLAATEVNVDDKTLRKFNDSILFSEGRYVVSLPWKEDGVKDTLLCNYRQAHKRLLSLNRRLSMTPDLAVQYHSVFSELRDLNIITEVTSSASDVPPVFYLPHHPVIRESSLSTRIRPVFNASAKGYNGVALNDCLETGPNLVPNLTAILIRFRRWRFAITADNTFLQIAVTESDQDVHRFLWDDKDTIRIMKFLRVPFGNRCSPFLLTATIRYHLSTYPDPPTSTELQSNLYVDDWLIGCGPDVAGRKVSPGMGI